MVFLVVSPIAGLLLAGLLMAVLNLWLGDGVMVHNGDRQVIDDLEHRKPVR